MKSLIPQKTHRKTIAVTLVTVVTCLLGATYYVYGLNGTILGWPSENTISDSVDLAPATNDQVKVGQEIKKSTIEQDQASSKDEPIGENQGAFTVTVSASNKSEQSYQLRVLIDTLITNGTCKLTLKKDSATITKDAKTQSLANNSTCQGFDVPLNELTSGEWSYTITVKDTNGATSSVTGVLTI
jgi:hypothetical protein